MDILNYRITCGPEVAVAPLHVLGDETQDAGVILRSSNNSQTLYLDGAGQSDWPTYLGITKSRGTQEHKEPIEPNDIIGGLQVYARTKAGTSLGYDHSETPLSGSIIFKAGDNINSSELLVAVKNDDVLAVKLVLDSRGNLKVAGNISTGDLVITDESADVVNTDAVKYIKVFHNGAAYAMPLYLIR